MKASNHELIDLEAIEVSRRDWKKSKAVVYRLNLDPRISNYSLSPNWYFPETKVIWRDYLYNNYMYIEFFTKDYN